MKLLGLILRSGLRLGQEPEVPWSEILSGQKPRHSWRGWLFGRECINIPKFLILLFLLVITGCENRPYYTEVELALGTVVEITCQDKQAIAQAIKEIKRIEKIANIFDPESEVSVLNKNGSIKASKDLLNIIKESLDIYKISGGAFDITVKPLSDIWKEKIKEQQNTKQKVIFPDDTRIQAALRLVGSDKIFINENESDVRFLKPGMAIDLGGIAKGYAVDAAIRRLKELNVGSALINAGGNIYCLGRKNNVKWRVSIRDPRSKEKTVFTFALEDKAVGTSGSYEQYFIYNNRRYSHIINPKTGYPVENNLLSATVIATTAVRADGLSTAVFVMGKEASLAMVRQLGEDVKVKLIEE